jgi:hypothetical protein
MISCPKPSAKHYGTALSRSGLHVWPYGEGLPIFFSARGGSAPIAARARYGMFAGGESCRSVPIAWRMWCPSLNCPSGPRQSARETRATPGCSAKAGKAARPTGGGGVSEAWPRRDAWGRLSVSLSVRRFGSWAATLCLSLSIPMSRAPNAVDALGGRLVVGLWSSAFISTLAGSGLPSGGPREALAARFQADASAS